MKQHVTRKAILIGCPGSKTILKGVSKDLVHMGRFLQSAVGGGWRKDEIQTLNNPTCNNVRMALRLAKVDYLMVYFSGHGFTDQFSNRMITLKDGKLCDLDLLNASARQLVIIDACRNYSETGLSGIPDLMITTNHYEGVSPHEMFDDYIRQSPYGKLIVHATQPGFFSYDDANYGGHFTNSLLKCSLNSKGSQFAAYTIEAVLPEVVGALAGKQIPSIALHQGNLMVPFVMNFPGAKLITKKEYDTIELPQLVTGLLIGAIVVGGIIALSE